MGWLEDLAKTTIYNYRNRIEDSDVITGTAEELSELFDEDVKGVPGETFEYHMATFEYAGFEPKKLGIMTKVVFEQNGRKAVKIQHGDGKNTYRSMTRENLLKGKGVKKTGDKHDSQGNKTGKQSFEVESALSKGCAEASTKAKGEILGNRLRGMKREIEISTHNAKMKEKEKRSKK